MKLNSVRETSDPKSTAPRDRSSGGRITHGFDLRGRSQRTTPPSENHFHCACGFSAPIDSHTCWTPWSVFQDGSGGASTLCTPREQHNTRCATPRRQRRVEQDEVPHRGHFHVYNPPKGKHRRIPKRLRTSPLLREFGIAGTQGRRFLPSGPLTPSQRFAVTYSGGKIAERRRVEERAAPPEAHRPATSTDRTQPGSH